MPFWVALVCVLAKQQVWKFKTFLPMRPLFESGRAFGTGRSRLRRRTVLLLKEYLTVQDMLRDTVGFVLKLRDVFRMQFEAFEAGVVNSQSGVEKLFHPNFLG